MKIKIKYLSDKIEKLKKTDTGDWVDLRAAEDIYIFKGTSALISLGVAIQLPDAYEAYIVPRSSTLKNFGIIQGNHFGVVDNSYCGNGDEWKMSAYAVRDTQIKINDRICQFRVQKKQPLIEFEEVQDLGNQDRGGWGSSGIQ